MGQNAKVCVTLNFNGRWLFDGAGWVYYGETERKNVIIEEGIDFASLTQLLRGKVGHDCSCEDWRLSYIPKGEEAGHPITIGDDDDLEAYKFINSMSGEHPWPMAIYIGPVVKERLQVPQPGVGEECLSGPRNSQKVDELEAEGKPQPNPMVVDVGLYGGGGVSQSIGMTNDIRVKNNVETGLGRGDKDKCEGDKGMGPEVILLDEVIGKRQDDVIEKSFGTGDRRIFEGDKGKCPESNHMDEVIGKRQEDATESGFGTGENLKSVGDKGKGPEMIQLGGVIGKSQEHAGDIGSGTGDMDILEGDMDILEGDRCDGLDVIHLGDTDFSSDDTEKCEGDRYKGVDLIAISSEEEDEEEDFDSGVKREEDCSYYYDWEDYEEDQGMRVSSEEDEVEEEVIRELEDRVPRSSTSPPSMENVEAMLDKATPRTQEPRRNLTEISEGQMFGSKVELHKRNQASNLQKILDDSSAEVGPNSPDFWVMVAALKEFIANEGAGEVPLEGSIPDMTSSTEHYVSLQKIYQAKAEADFLAMEQRTRNILKRIGQDPNSITKITIKSFCKNARKLNVCRYRVIEEEFSSPNLTELQKYITDEDYSTAVGFYILLRAVDRFAANYNSFPGQFDGELDEDISRLRSIAVSILGDLGFNSSTLSEDLINEICRFGAAELHAVAALIGGIASQEVIKLITKQFIPMCGTFIFNGIDHKSQLLSL